ncbi:uncharacterized protein LOC131638811 [Vicia villosa]|uniref:uncharacterized protein LOC131638811 n=1 Tax=Vicia villosa TaxID=3911 RepID=UPI00273B33F6|nr:uncharacterized protein LOC131638811 [Vicia villosa]
MVDTVRRRLSTWNNNYLSIGGRIILLNSVLCAIPVYFLSFFKAPAESFRREGEELVWKDGWAANLNEENYRLKKKIVGNFRGLTLKENVEDWWIWAKKTYSVKDAYTEIMEGYHLLNIEDQGLVAVWNKIVPLKVLVLVWRMWQNKIPTRDDLIKQGIAAESQGSCPFGCGKEESVNHIFFECLIATFSWSDIVRWLNIKGVFHNTATQNFYLFAYFNNSGRSIQEKFLVIWYACVWIIWKRRNDIVFKKKHKLGEAFIYDIQLTSWWWLRSKVKRFQYSFYQWIFNPKACLGWNDGYKVVV